MDKAIKMLTDIKNASSVFGIRPDEIDEALAELQAYEAKIDELKEWCSDELDKYSEYQTDIECGLFQAYNNVLQKLEEPTNA